MPPFKPGHAYLPRKDGQPPGRSPAQIKQHRNAALAVREIVDPVILAEMHMAILMGHDPKVVYEIDEETGEQVQRVTWEEKGGIPPTLDQKVAAAKELWNRGWGQPAQSIHLEADVRAHASMIGGVVQVGALSAGELASIRQVLRAASARHVLTDTTTATDAEFTDHPGQPAPVTADASATTPASGDQVVKEPE